jgi:hypothetical protein
MITLAALAACFMSLQDQPEKASISLRVGIVGGIVAPKVTLSIDIVAEKDAVTVKMMMLKDDKPVVTTGTMKRKEFDALLKEIDAVWKLPVEEPRGCEDIYALDTGVAVKSGDRSWSNGAPGGCNHGTSKVQPTAAERAAFKKIVERIVKEGQARATKGP